MLTAFPRRKVTSYVAHMSSIFKHGYTLLQAVILPIVNRPSQHRSDNITNTSECESGPSLAEGHGFLGESNCLRGTILSTPLRHLHCYCSGGAAASPASSAPSVNFRQPTSWAAAAESSGVQPDGHLRSRSRCRRTPVTAGVSLNQ